MFNKPTPHSSSVDPSRYVALGLTHVQYDADDSLAKLMALVTLSPIFLLCSYVTIILYRRELTFLNALIGQLGCEGVNWGLKRLIRQPRPHSDLGKGYGMPSSHSQFLGFFCAFFLSHFVLHHPRAAKPRTLVNAMRRFEHLCAMIGIVALTALTCYSRYHLSYHSPAQILVGISIGLVIGFCYYYLTEYLPRQPVRLPAPLGSPIEETKPNPFKGSSNSSAISTSPTSSPRRRKTLPRDGSRHTRRRSSLSSLMPELHPAPPIRQLILDHPLAVAFRLRDSWTVWLDGGIEGEYEAWRSEWERRRTPYPYSAGGDTTPTLAQRVLGASATPTLADPASIRSPTASTPAVISSTTHVDIMKQTLRQASQCEPTSTAFCVGCVITDAATHKVLAVGYSREIEGNTHAEQCALEKLVRLCSATTSSTTTLNLNLYTSMEPCSERLSGAVPCAQRIIAFNDARHVLNGVTLRINTIYQGAAEPQDFIAVNTGLKLLSDAGVQVFVVTDSEDSEWIQREAVRLAKYGHTDQPTERVGDSRRWVA